MSIITTKKHFFLLCLISLCLLFNPQVLAKKKARSSPPLPKYIISQEVVEALSHGDLNQAAVQLRHHPTSAKSMYLLREVTRILISDSSSDKPSRKKAHQYYKKIAISYHNLFLFLKAKGDNQNNFFRKAINFYKKSNKGGNAKQKQEIAILMAALYAAKGDTKKAERLFDKNNNDKFGLDYELQVTLATYYAAVGDVEKTIEALRSAYRESPETIMSWLAVGDDFYLLRNDPQFIRLLDEWHISKKQKDRKLTRPHKPEPKLKFSAPPMGYSNKTTI